MTLSYANCGQYSQFLLKSLINFHNEETINEQGELSPLFTFFKTVKVLFQTIFFKQFPKK